MTKHKKNKSTKNETQEDKIIEILKTHRETLNNIESNTKKEVVSTDKSKGKSFWEILVWIRIHILPYLAIASLIVSGFSLWKSIQIYNLGEEYKKTLNPIALRMDFYQKLKIAPSEDSEYFTLETHDRYPITYNKNNGEITEKYLFKYNVDTDRIDAIKLEPKLLDEIRDEISLSDNSKAKDLHAYIQVKDKNGNFSFIKDEIKDTDQKEYFNNLDEVLCILDPSFFPPSKPYTGVYCLALIGKNNQPYLTTFLTTWGGKIGDLDTMSYFEGIDLYNEYRWSDIEKKHPEAVDSKELAQKTYELALQFLKTMR